MQKKVIAVLILLLVIPVVSAQQCGCETDFCNSDCGTASGRSCSIDTDCQITGDFLSGMFKMSLAENQLINTILSFLDIIRSEVFQIERKIVESHLAANDCLTELPALFFTPKGNDPAEDPQGKLEEVIDIVLTTRVTFSLAPSSYGNPDLTAVSNRITEGDIKLAANNYKGGATDYCCAYKLLVNPAGGDPCI